MITKGRKHLVEGEFARSEQGDGKEKYSFKVWEQGEEEEGSEGKDYGAVVAFGIESDGNIQTFLVGNVIESAKIVGELKQLMLDILRRTPELALAMLLKDVKKEHKQDEENFTRCPGCGGKNCGN